MAEPVRYHVSMPKPHSHLFEVEAHFPSRASPLTVALPVWTPGSYLVREYARHLQDMRAVDDSGNALSLRRLDKRSFRVETGGRPCRFLYRVYANELSVRTSHLDSTHGYFNGATLFLYSEDTRNREHHVTFSLPSGWRAFCALTQEGPHFVASDYDALIDSPFELGPNTPLSYTAAGVPHQIVVWGDTVSEPERFTEDLGRICEEAAKLFGGLPLERYLFLVYLTERGRGGLEHRASSTLVFPRQGLSSGRGWEDFLTLAAHEYFHLWNIKRIKPATFAALDYSQESYTSLLWFFEGGTSYYDNVLVRRAGLMSAARFVSRLGETLTTLHSTPGRKVQTLADASWMSWVKHYRPDENSPNSAISYYSKGEVVCALLDLELRRLTSGVRTLDDLMRLLWKRAQTGVGLPEDGVEKAAEELVGKSLSAFFERAIRSTEELDYSAFESVGLEVRFRLRESLTDKGGTPARTRTADLKSRGWLGFQPKGNSGVGVVLEGSPAAEAGLYADDEIVALDGFKIDAAGLLARCDEKRPGEQVRLSIFRRERLLEIPIILGSKPAEAAYLARVDRPSEAQKSAYQAWLSAPWDDPNSER